MLCLYVCLLTHRLKGRVGVLPVWLQCLANNGPQECWHEWWMEEIIARIWEKAIKELTFATDVKRWMGIHLVIREEKAFCRGNSESKGLWGMGWGGAGSAWRLAPVCTRHSWTGSSGLPWGSGFPQPMDHQNYLLTSFPGLTQLSPGSAGGFGAWPILESRALLWSALGTMETDLPRERLDSGRLRSRLENSNEECDSGLGRRWGWIPNPPELSVLGLPWWACG